MFTIEEMPQKQVAETLGCSVEAREMARVSGQKEIKGIAESVSVKLICLAGGPTRRLHKLETMHDEQLEFSIAQYADGHAAAEPAPRC